MKHLKHILVATLTMFVAFALAIPAFAGSITITRDATYDGSDGRTYTAYKVFDADTSLTGSNTQSDKQPDYTTDGPIAYTMALDNPWVEKLWDFNANPSAATTGQAWFNVALAADGSKYVVTPAKALTDADAAAIAAFLKANKPANATGTTITPGTAATVDDGYYYIEASDGATNATLVTTDVTIVEKNTYVGVKKETAETSYSVGDTVTYTATVDVPADASKDQPIVLHDEMASVLKFNNKVTATVDSDAFTGFTVATEDLSDNKCTFEITIPVTDAILGKSIVFTYTAELTSAAADPDTGFVNKLFGEKNGYKTTPDEPKVYTFDFDFSKEFVGSTDQNLKATFELRTDADDATTAIKLIAGNGAGSYIVADSEHANDAGVIITSANNAAINVQGLKAGTYYLVEKTTSTGYNLLDGPATVVIRDTSDANHTVISHEVTIDGNASTATAPAKIQNNKGTVLPSTGGIGTTILYIVGGILVVGGCVALVTKRRLQSEK